MRCEACNCPAVTKANGFYTCERHRLQAYKGLLIHRSKRARRPKNKI